VLVTGAGSTLTNSGLFRFGIGGFSHSLTITNGGSVAVGGADGFCLGCGYSSTNSLLITGSGSLLQSTAKFRVGLDYFGAQGAFGGINNNVKVLDGGTLESDHIRVQTGNSITNFGGIYQFTTAAPEIAVTNGSPTGVIVLTNGTVSFRNVASADVFANVGTGGNQLTNITFQGNNTFRLNNSSNATGTVAYNFNTGSGATNYTALELVNGGASWRSERLNIGSNGRMLVSNSLGTVAATFTNQGTTTVAYSRMGWNSNVVTSGRFISDHSTNSFAKDVTVTSTGTLEGQSREWLTFSQSLFINSLNTNQFNLTMATVEFKGSSGGIVHTNAITGSEDGPLGVGYINNFAYGTLRMTNATDTLCLQCGNLPLTNNALYVGFLDLGGNTSLVANVHAPLGINLYYLNSTEDSRNTYLQNKSYQLLSCDGVTAGGMLLPAVPEPSCLLWATLAAGGLLLRRRRPLSADSPVSSK
jgi:T5SS/PEP-CTERM-associated repeat protein